MLRDLFKRTDPDGTPDAIALAAFRGDAIRQPFTAAMASGFPFVECYRALLTGGLYRREVTETAGVIGKAGAR